MGNLRRIIFKRLVNAFITIMGIITLNFFIVHIVPYVTGVGPEQLLTPRGINLPANLVDINRHQFGLDRPIQERFVLYVFNTFTGNWGYSYERNIPVAQIVGDDLKWTLLLVGTSTVITVIVGMVIGSYAAYRRGKLFDLFTTNLGIFFWGMPYFWLALMMKIMFLDISPIRAQPPRGLGLQWWPRLPTEHYYDYVALGATWQWTAAHIESLLLHLILPVASLTIGSLLGISLIMRNALIDVMTEDYIVTARAKGLSHRDILRNHAVPNGMPPMITLIALNIAFVLGGAYQVEYVFVYQGIGWETINAINVLDFPVLQFILVIGGMAIVIANLIADFVLIKVDPRIKIA